MGTNLDGFKGIREICGWQTASGWLSTASHLGDGMPMIGESLQSKLQVAKQLLSPPDFSVMEENLWEVGLSPQQAWRMDLWSVLNRIKSCVQLGNLIMSSAVSKLQSTLLSPCLPILAPLKMS